MNTIPIMTDTPPAQMTAKKAIVTTDNQDQKFANALDQAKGSAVADKTDTQNTKDSTAAADKQQQESTKTPEKGISDQPSTGQDETKKAGTEPSPLGNADTVNLLSGQQITISPVCGYVFNQAQPTVTNTATNPAEKIAVTASKNLSAIAVTVTQQSVPGEATNAADVPKGNLLLHNAADDGKVLSGSQSETLTTAAAPKISSTADNEQLFVKTPVLSTADAAANSSSNLEITDLKALNHLAANASAVPVVTTDEKPQGQAAAATNLATETTVAAPTIAQNTTITSLPAAAVPASDNTAIKGAKQTNEEQATQATATLTPANGVAKVQENSQGNNTNLTFYDQSAPKKDADDTKTPLQVTTSFATKLDQATDVTKTAGTSAAMQTANTNTQDQYNITSQIIEKMRILNKPQSSEMVIKLKPEHLGQLTLKVAVNDGVVSASFHSENAQVRNVIESSLNQLKQELTNNGIKVDNVGVYTGLDSFLANDQHNTAQQQTIKIKNRNRNNFEDDIIAEVENISQNSSVTDSGVDYRI